MYIQHIMMLSVIFCVLTKAILWTCFFISVFFIIPSFLNKGKSVFIKDKFIRLGGAVLIGSILVNSIKGLILYSDKITLSGFISWYYQKITSLNWGDFIGVTWFCWTLLVFTLIWSLFTDKMYIQKKSEKPIPSFIKIFAFCIVMIPINYIALSLNNVVGDAFLGFHDIKYFPTYIAAFIFGIKTYQNNWLDKINYKYGIFGIIMFSFFYSLESGWILGHGFNDAIFRTFCAVGMILFLIYVFKTYFNQSNKFTKTLSRASFPAYVIQFVFLITCFAFLKPFYFSWSPWLITLSTGVISVLSSFMLGIVLYRLPFFRRIF